MQNTHHLMIFVGENVAVPDIPTGFIEGRFDTRYLPGEGGDHILGGIFHVTSWLRHRRAQDNIFEPVALTNFSVMLYQGLVDNIGCEFLPVNDLKVHQV